MNIKKQDLILEHISKTMNKIYFDLTQSEFIYTYKDIEIRFSSQLKLNAFTKQVDSYVETEKLKLNYKYQANILFDYVFILNLYKNVEKRGFYAKYKGKELNKDYTIKTEIEV